MAIKIDKNLLEILNTDESKYTQNFKLSINTEVDIFNNDRKQKRIVIYLDKDGNECQKAKVYD
jgi:hypothetical protein